LISGRLFKRKENVWVPVPGALEGETTNDLTRPPGTYSAAYEHQSGNIRFATRSGHSSAHSACLLSARSGHRGGAPT